MTVPDTFRRRAKSPKILILHRCTLNKKDVEQKHGFAVTRPLHAITDLAAAESVSREIIERALTSRRQRGLITIRDISELRQKRQIPKMV